MNNTSENQPLVSVFVITYNHAPYIRECLDSILTQTFRGSFEICIGEDESTDGTREICQEYARQYPDKIRLFLRSRNDPARRKYPAPFMNNSLETMKACRGVYIAFCEGDDYWIDPLKLQKQVDFLAAHPECSACCTSALKKKDGEEQLLPETTLHGDSPFFLTLENMLEDNHIVTCTVLARNRLFEFPEWAGTLRQTDWTHSILCAQKGKIAWLPEYTAVRRVHPGGVWTSSSSAAMFQSGIDCYTCFRKHLPAEHHPQIDRKLAERRFQLANALVRSGEKSGRAWRSLRESFYSVWKNRSVSRVQFFKTWLMFLLPGSLLQKMQKQGAGN